MVRSWNGCEAGVSLCHDDGLYTYTPPPLTAAGSMSASFTPSPYGPGIVAGSGKGGQAIVSPINGYSFGKGGDGSLDQNNFGIGQSGGAVISYTLCQLSEPDCASSDTAGDFIDIGLRVNQGTSLHPSIQKIAIESPAGNPTSSLVIVKNNKKYHVALVDPSDQYATKLIINTGSAGQKALRKYTGNDGITN
jgi:hypothetical protein